MIRWENHLINLQRCLYKHWIRIGLLNNLYCTYIYTSLIAVDMKFGNKKWNYIGYRFIIFVSLFDFGQRNDMFRRYFDELKQICVVQWRVEFAVSVPSRKIDSHVYQFRTHITRKLKEITDKSNWIAADFTNYQTSQLTVDELLVFE